jgi:hypothetical protein
LLRQRGSSQPETGQPFELYADEVQFLRRAFTLMPKEGCPTRRWFVRRQKSGKTALAAMVAIYVGVVIGGSYAEVYALANYFEQSRGAFSIEFYSSHP